MMSGDDDGSGGDDDDDDDALGWCEKNKFPLFFLNALCA
jgi:hypothetical protein